MRIRDNAGVGGDDKESSEDFLAPINVWDVYVNGVMGSDGVDVIMQNMQRLSPRYRTMAGV